MTLVRETCNELGNNLKKFGAALEAWEEKDQAWKADMEAKLAALEAKLNVPESPQNAPKPETLTSEPSSAESPVEPKAAPKDKPSEVPAHVSLLAASAMAEASKIKGAGSLVARIAGIQQATTIQGVNDNARLAIGEASILHDDRDVDTSGVMSFLSQIRDLTDDGMGGNLVGDMADVEKGDMTE